VLCAVFQYPARQLGRPKGRPQPPCCLRVTPSSLLQPRPLVCVGCEVVCTARDCSLILYAAAQESWICSSLGNVGNPSGSGMGLKVRVRRRTGQLGSIDTNFYTMTRKMDGSPIVGMSRGYAPSRLCSLAVNGSHGQLRCHKFTQGYGKFTYDIGLI
jgi:hypothetical protein